MRDVPLEPLVESLEFWVERARQFHVVRGAEFFFELGEVLEHVGDLIDASHIEGSKYLDRDGVINDLAHYGEMWAQGATACMNMRARPLLLRRSGAPSTGHGDRWARRNGDGQIGRAHV